MKQSGLKTEAAFAQALGLSGNPYQVILELENRNDEELSILVVSQ